MGLSESDLNRSIIGTGIGPGAAAACVNSVQLQDLPPGTGNSQGVIEPGNGQRKE
jgi:hypothetical protein